MIPDDTGLQAAAFDAIGQRYDEAFADKGAQIAAAQWLLERLPRGARVLDVGAGSGIPTARALVEGGMEVVGIDISQEMVRIARGNVPGARFEQRSIMDPALPERELDAATAFFSLLMLRRSDIPVALRNIRRALRPGGYVQLAMVEGDLDYAEVTFLGQRVRVSLLPQGEVEALLRGEGIEILDTTVVDFTPAGAHPERQLFYSGRVG